jgi:hypothetical protein
MNVDEEDSFGQDARYVQVPPDDERQRQRQVDELRNIFRAASKELNETVPGSIPFPSDRHAKKLGAPFSVTALVSCAPRAIAAVMSKWLRKRRAASSKWKAKQVAQIIQHHHERFIRQVIEDLRAPPRFTREQADAYPGLAAGETFLKDRFAKSDVVEDLLAISHEAYILHLSVWTFATEASFPSQAALEKFLRELIQQNKRTSEEAMTSYRPGSGGSALNLISVVAHFSPIFFEGPEEGLYRRHLEAMGPYLAILDGAPQNPDLSSLATFLHWVYQQRGRRDAFTTCFAWAWCRAFRRLMSSNDETGWTVMSAHVGTYFFDFFEHLFTLYRAAADGHRTI